MFLLTTAISLPPGILLSGPGHDHGEAPGANSHEFGGRVQVTEQGRRNLGIEVTEAEVVEIEKTLETVIEIVPIPTQTAMVASRIPGRVKRLSVTSGESVEAGDPLVEIESFQAGDPPPSVSYEAPISGIVSHRDASVGESVAPNGHLVEIADLSEVFAEISLFEGQIDQVEPGQVVRLHLESFPDRTFEGKIDLIDGKLDRETRSLRAYAKISNPEGKLRPHMRGTGHVVVEQLDAAIGIPHRAVTGDPGNLSVFVQSDEDGLEYEQRPVVLGEKDDRYVEVIEGVLPGEQVVVSGNYQLQFIEGESAIPAGGGHGHAHGPGGEHVTEEDADAHGHGEGGGRSPSFESPLSLVLVVGLVISLALNLVLLFLKRPTTRAA